jgi:hypothetical protein
MNKKMFQLLRYDKKFFLRKYIIEKVPLEK